VFAYICTYEIGFLVFHSPPAAASEREKEFFGDTPNPGKGPRPLQSRSKGFADFTKNPGWLNRQRAAPFAIPLKGFCGFYKKSGMAQ